MYSVRRVKAVTRGGQDGENRSIKGRRSRRGRWSGQEDKIGTVDEVGRHDGDYG
jgi:hypothetical protein